MKKSKRIIRESYKQRAFALSKGGLTCREIEKHIPRSKTTIAKYIKEVKEGQKLDKKTKKE